MNPDVRRQIWPVFVAEAHEHVASIGAVVLGIQRNPGDLDAIEGVRRTAHGLKGSASSLGLRDLEVLAHGVEEVLAGVEDHGGLGREATQAILDALAAMDAALSAAEAGEEPTVAQREALLGALQAARGGVRPRIRPEEVLGRIEEAFERLRAPLAPDERGRLAREAGLLAGALAEGTSSRLAELARGLEAAFGEVGRVEGNEAARWTARIAEDLVQARDALAGDVAPAASGEGAPLSPAEGPLRQEREDRAVRVLGSTLDSLARRLEMLSLAESRHGRRSRELAEAERALREAISGIQGATSALRGVGVDAGRAELELATGRLYSLAGDLRRLAREGQRETEQQRLTGAILREDLRALRMVPAALALEPAARAVHEAALRLGKEIELRVEGGEVRLDRRLVEDLRAPLLHLVRNAVDHGIESPAARRAAGKPSAGRLLLRVEPRGSRVGVVVEDDGAGFDLRAIRSAAVRAGLAGEAEAARRSDAEAARWVFAPGLSTAARVTTLSGRGVGLDAVADAMSRMRGAVEVKSEPGTGTRFELDLPLTLAATAGVLVRVGEHTAILPADAVERVLLLEPAASARPPRAIVVGDAEHPCAPLEEVLGLPVPPGPRRTIGLVLALGSRRGVITVDEVLGEHEVVVSALGGLAARVAHLAGAAMMDDGRVLGVLAAAELLRRMPPVAAPPRTQGLAPRVAVVADDTLASRTLMATLLERVGFVVRLAADGDAALAALAEGPCDLLVTDVQMPRLDGLALTRRVRGDPRWRELPVILVSTLDSPRDVEAGTAAGATAYLSKRELAGDVLSALALRLLGDARSR